MEATFQIVPQALFPAPKMPSLSHSSSLSTFLERLLWSTDAQMAAVDEPCLAAEGSESYSKISHLKGDQFQRGMSLWIRVIIPFCW